MVDSCAEWGWPDTLGTIQGAYVNSLIVYNMYKIVANEYSSIHPKRERNYELEMSHKFGKIELRGLICDRFGQTPWVSYDTDLGEKCF